MKRCKKCENLKTEKEFVKDRRSKDGLGSRCKSCHNKSFSLWRLLNVETMRQRARDYRDANIEKIQIKARTWRELYPEKVVEYTRNRRARISNNGGNITAKEWVQLKKFYENKCLCCGRKEPEIKLSLDHIIPLVLGGKNIIENAQPLCISCNSRKGARNMNDYRIDKLRLK